MSRKSQSYAKQVSDAQVMATGLKSNIGKLQKRGTSEEFIASLDGWLNSTIARNSEQEKLKADLKSATAALHNSQQQLDLIMKEATTVVKLETPQTQWKEYGITDKR
jgi:hypothetical protein